MAERPLRGCRILAVEDEYMVAHDLKTELCDAGAVVPGPVGPFEQATDILTREQDIDGAVLDINLHGEMAYPVADLLLNRGTPFGLTTTGYDALDVASRFEHIVRCEKPVTSVKIMRALGRTLGTGG